MGQDATYPTFLKWAGGKRKIIDQVAKSFPKKINSYYEPFLGAGFVFFYVKRNFNPKNITISDINKDLIATFIAVRDQPDLLIKHLKFFKKNNSKEFYYETREKFNKYKYRGIKRAACFIYINKTCFNGLYRVNKQNKFNVPYGNYKNPKIFNEKTIMEASKLLHNVTILCQDYENIKKKVKKNDFVYLDPCYDPLTRTSFVNYTPESFCEDDRNRLAIFIKAVKNKGGVCVLSNNDVPEVRKIYKGFKIRKILAPRFINSIGSQRGVITELVISTN